MEKWKRSLTQDWSTIVAVQHGSDKRQFQSIAHVKGEKTDIARSAAARIDKPIQQFCTKSFYCGQWDELGFSGYGIYTYPHGVIYEGHFFDGQFHGSGSLIYPNGHCVDAMWERGKPIDKTVSIKFPSGMEFYTNKWGYCQQPDRRFELEIADGFNPAGQEYLTAHQPTRVIPPNCYDTEAGFYNPKSRIITSPREYEKKDTKKDDIDEEIEDEISLGPRKESINSEEIIIEWRPKAKESPRKESYVEWRPNVKESARRTSSFTSVLNDVQFDTCVKSERTKSILKTSDSIIMAKSQMIVPEIKSILLKTKSKVIEPVIADTAHRDSEFAIEYVFDKGQRVSTAQPEKTKSEEVLRHKSSDLTYKSPSVIGFSKKKHTSISSSNDSINVARIGLGKSLMRIGKTGKEQILKKLNEIESTGSQSSATCLPPLKTQQLSQRRKYSLEDIRSTISQLKRNERERYFDYPQKGGKSIKKVPTKAEEKWILEHCRKAWDEPTGYRPDLYEFWTSGKSEDIDDIIYRFSEDSEAKFPQDLLTGMPDTDRPVASFVRQSNVGHIFLGDSLTIETNNLL